MIKGLLSHIIHTFKMDIALLDSDLDDEDLLLLIPSPVRRRSIQYGRFNLNNLTLEECKQLFRFEKHDISRLRIALGIPSNITTDTRYTVSGKLTIRIVIIVTIRIIIVERILKNA